MQEKHNEWHEQWSMLEDNERFLFEDWILPHTMDCFKDKEVLECGCGGGQHTMFMAPLAKHVTAVDLNTTEIAKKRNADADNVTFVEADIATMDLGKQFDVAICIGVAHHTDSPEATVANIRRHLKPGGLMIVWVYSTEGNWLTVHVVEGMRKLFLRRLSRPALLGVSRAITALMYPPIYTVYLLPLTFLPYYEYFQNFRKLSFGRNVLNVFDKLNAPQTDFISRARAEAFTQGLTRASVLPYMGVSYSVSGFVPE